MPVTVPVSLGALIDETLDGLYRASERPRRLVVGSDAVDDINDTQFTLSAGHAAVTDMVEGGAELMLVVGKTQDATPVYTVARGYLGTDRETHPTGKALLLNPPYPRATVKRWVLRAINGLMNTELPYIETSSHQTIPVGGLIELPEDTIEVLAVRHYGVLDGRVADVGGWQFEDGLPASILASGKGLRVHSGVTPDDEVLVTVRRPYSFQGEGEEATVQLPVAAQDIPVLWATAYGQSRREVSRAELDKIEEWNQEQAIRAGVNLRMIRDMWGEVYRRVDEAKRVHRLPKHRPYRKMPKRW